MTPPDVIYLYVCISKNAFVGWSHIDKVVLSKEVPEIQIVGPYHVLVPLFHIGALQYQSLKMYHCIISCTFYTSSYVQRYQNQKMYQPNWFILLVLFHFLILVPELPILENVLTSLLVPSHFCTCCSHLGTSSVTLPRVLCRFILGWIKDSFGVHN